MSRGTMVIKRIKQDILQCRVALLIIVAYVAVTQFFFHTICPFAILTGFACPGCGLTRAAGALLTGHFEMAWKYNPTIYLWMALILEFLFFRYIRGRKMPVAGLTAGMVCLITIGVYIMRLCCRTLPEIPGEGIFMLVHHRM